MLLTLLLISTDPSSSRFLLDQSSTLYQVIQQEFFFICKYLKFHQKIFNIFNIIAQNIDCGYTLGQPHGGGSSEYPQSMFWNKNKKNRYTSAYPSFTVKIEFEGVYFTRICYSDGIKSQHDLSCCMGCNNKISQLSNNPRITHSSVMVSVYC